jgi:hypothetical protein
MVFLNANPFKFFMLGLIATASTLCINHDVSAQQSFPIPEQIDKIYRKMVDDEEILPEKTNGIDIYKIYHCSLGDPDPKYGEFTTDQFNALEDYKFKHWISCVMLSEIIQTAMISPHANEETMIIESNASGFTAKTIEDAIDLDRASGKRLEYTFEKLKKKYLTVEVFHPHYDSKIDTLDKDVRGGYVFMQLSQSNLDQLMKKYKEDLDLKKLDALIKYHPYNKSHENAIIFADTIRLVNALKIGDEKPFENFKKERPGSPLVKLADKWIVYFKSARTSWEEAQRKNDVASYETFIRDYENSKYLNDAKLKLVDAAANKYLPASNPDTIAYFIEQYLEPYKDLSGFKKNYFETARNNCMVALEKTYFGEERNVFSLQKIHQLWDHKHALEKRLKAKFAKIDSRYKTVICSAMFQVLTSSATKDSQLRLESDFKSKFYEYETDDVIEFILENASDKNGKVVIYGKNYLVSDLKKQLGEDYSDQVEHLSITHSLKTPDCVETLSWVDNKYQGIQVVTNAKGKFYEINFTNFPTYDQEHFYKNGIIARSDFYSDEGYLYHYEFDNGKNITLAQLQTSIDQGDQAYNQKNYKSALDIYEQASINNYPSNVPQNIYLEKAIQKTSEKLELLRKESRSENGLAPAYISDETFKTDNDGEYKLLLLFPKGINKVVFGFHSENSEEANRLCQSHYTIYENTREIHFRLENIDTFTDFDCSTAEGPIYYFKNEQTGEVYQLTWGEATFSPVSK